MTTKVITDSLLYVEGGDCFGKAKKITPPKITYGGVEIKDISSIGTLTLNNGKIEPLTCEITLNSFYPEIFAKTANPYKAVNLKIYSNSFEYQNDTKTGSESIKLFMRCSPKEFGLLGEINEQDNMEYDMSFNVSMAQLIVGGRELYHIDFTNQIFVVDGVDIRGEILANLGLK
jgi:P2 family phage contractile tail tube protein